MMDVRSSTMRHLKRRTLVIYGDSSAEFDWTRCEDDEAESQLASYRCDATARLQQGIS